MTNKLFVYLPCFNEELNITNLTNEWQKEKDTLLSLGYELVLYAIDDKSTDNTLSVLHTLEITYNNFNMICHKTNYDLGGAIKTAITSFLKNANEDDLMLFMDADNTHKPKYIYSMIACLYEETGCIIASRYQNGAEVCGLSTLRQIMSDGAKLYYSVVLNVPNVKDYTCGYRLYTHQALKLGWDKYGDNIITSRTFACMMQLLYNLNKAGVTFGEIPFTLEYGDKQGVSSMNISKTTLNSITTALKLRFRR